MLNVIGIVGYAGAGKDTIAQRLVENYGYTKLSFADPIKYVCSYVYDLDKKLFYDPILKEIPLERLGGKTPRQVLQLIGTESFRELIHSKTWLEKAERTIIEGLQVGKRWVLSDTRFPNEEEMIRGFTNAEIWGIERDVDLGQKKYTHQSESHTKGLIERADVVFDNSQDIDYLWKCVDYYMDGYQQGLELKGA